LLVGKNEQGGRNVECVYLSDPERSALCSIPGIFDVGSEIVFLAAATIPEQMSTIFSWNSPGNGNLPVNRNEINLATCAPIHEFSEPIETDETTGLVARDTWCTERGTIGERHHMLAVHIHSMLGRHAGSTPGAHIRLVESEEVF